MAGEPRTPVRAQATVTVFPRAAPAPPRRSELSRFVPSGKSVAIALAIVVLGAGLYLVARESSLFALDRVAVSGAPPQVAGRVREALKPFMGSSLVTLDGTGVERTLAALPVVAEASYDRDFPHTLRVFVQPEHPVAVVRRGPDSWLVSAHGRVMEKLMLGARPDLPRIWVPGTVRLSPGGVVAGSARRAVRAAKPLVLTRLHGRVSAIRATSDELTLVLRSGLELRLGDARNLPVKLAIGLKIASVVGPASGYVDLSVPGRPVSRVNPKPAG